MTSVAARANSACSLISQCSAFAADADSWSIRDSGSTRPPAVPNACRARNLAPTATACAPSPGLTSTWRRKRAAAFARSPACQSAAMLAPRALSNRTPRSTSRLSVAAQRTDCCLRCAACVDRRCLILAASALVCSALATVKVVLIILSRRVHAVSSDSDRRDSVARLLDLHARVPPAGASQESVRAASLLLFAGSTNLA